MTNLAMDIFKFIEWTIMLKNIQALVFEDRQRIIDKLGNFSGEFLGKSVKEKKLTRQYLVETIITCKYIWL